MRKRDIGRQIFITHFDMQRLNDLIEKASTKPSRDSRNLEELETELLRAEIIDPVSIPADVITMNSRVCLKDMGSGEDRIYTLVFPEDADLENGRISVLAPVGTAMIGYRKGDCITWRVPGGVKQLKVKQILYQPEAAGDFHL